MSIENISNVSVNVVVDEISEYVSAVIGIRKSIAHMPAFFLWGAPGIGKSAAIRQCAKKIEEATKKRVIVTDIRLLLFSPVDLRGVPVVSANEFGKVSEWMIPKIFQLDLSEEVINILFLDELTAAAPSIQAAAYQICLDKTIGEHKLPENCLVIAAGNRTSDRSVAYRMPNALANRMIHYQVEADYHGWMKWALKENVHPLVVSFLSFMPDKLNCEDVELNEVAFPTPRSWMFVSDLLYAMPHKKVEELHHMLSGSIGTGMALELEAFAKVKDTIPSVPGIFKGERKPCPRTADGLHALIGAMTMHIRQNLENISISALARGCEYAEQFPADYKALFFTNLSMMDGLMEKLLMVPEYLQWSRKGLRR